MPIIILVFICALSLSVIAAFYSIAGLIAIFAASPVPIAIMGSALEGSKLVVASWLYRNWTEVPILMKSYLMIALVILMFLTSMGIFGFLSKAHIEQTASANEGVAQVERIVATIARNEEIIARAEAKINDLQTSGTGATTQIQNQIDVEQGRIDGAYARIQPAIDEQNAIIARQSELYEAELQKIDDDLATLQGYIDAGDIKKAQGMVGAKADGAYGPATAAAFTAYQDRKKAERQQWLNKIEQSQSNTAVVAAREEIKRLRDGVESQIANSNQLINNLRSQLQSTDGTNSLQAELDEQNQRIKDANIEIDTLNEQKFALESEYRKFEAEVGPVKYIAELIYGGEADHTMLEQAVRWVIIMIVSVFDPLAVILLIAANWSLIRHQAAKSEEVPHEKETRMDIVESIPVPSPVASSPVDDRESTIPVEQEITQLIIEDPVDIEEEVVEDVIYPNTVVVEGNDLKTSTTGKVHVKDKISTELTKPDKK